MAGFAPGSRAQIQNTVAGLGIQKLHHRHGTGFLNIVQPGLMVRVFSRSVASIVIEAFFYPGNLFQGKSSPVAHLLCQVPYSLLLPSILRPAPGLKGVKAKPLDPFTVIAGLKSLIFISQQFFHPLLKAYRQFRHLISILYFH